jgi:Tetracyclin repressor-like, C-terminal domain
MMISAFCVFRIANRHTFGAPFDRDLTSVALRDHYRTMLGDLVVGYLTSGRAEGSSRGGEDRARRTVV